MTINHPRVLAISALIVAWFADFLFWGKEPGISFFIFVWITILCGLALLWIEGRRPALASLVLLPFLLFFSLFTWLRQEPMTVFFDVCATLVGMAILANTLTGGKWLWYTLRDMISGLLNLIGSVVVRAGQALPSLRSKPVPAATTETAPARRHITPFLRGLLLAIPLLILFTALFSAADPIFNQSVQRILTFINIKDLPVYLVRGMLILVGAYVLAGIYLHGIFASGDETVQPDAPGILPHFAGWTEPVVILVCIDLLFASFVAIQFRYFFGGQANIHIDGYTYAEYARRGFSELVLVAFFSLLLVMGLSAITRRETRAQRRIFSAASAFLVAAVIVILVSAYQRLLLYETAYGFSRVRTYTHIFMIWLGALLVAVLVLEVLNQERSFALAGLLACLGFGLTLNLINVDAFIVRQNVARARLGEELDVPYLATLSNDALPQLLAEFNAVDASDPLHSQAAAAVTCRIWARQDEPGPFLPPTWQSYNQSAARADDLIAQNQSALNAFRPTYSDLTGWVAPDGGQTIACYQYSH